MPIFILTMLYVLFYYFLSFCGIIFKEVKNESSKIGSRGKFGVKK